MVHAEHTEQAAHLAGKPNCKSGKKKMNWQEKGGNKPNPGQIMLCLFKLHNTPSLLVTVSSTPSKDSSWIMRNNSSDVKNASILFLWSLCHWSQQAFCLHTEYTAHYEFHLPENRHENFRPCGPS